MSQIHFPWKKARITKHPPTLCSLQTDSRINERGCTVLLAVYILGHQEEPPIRTNAVAEMLYRSPATVTETFQQLDREGLVTYESYKGVSLTNAGRQRAAELHESYVTVS